MTEPLSFLNRLGVSRWDAEGRQLDWRTRQEIERIQDEAAVAASAIEAAENRAARAIDQALINGELLAQHAINSLERIDRRVGEVSKHNRDLEYACREIERVFTLAAAQQLGSYLTRRRG